MKKQKLTMAFKSMLDLFVEADHMEHEFKTFLERLLEDYIWNDKKMSYSITSFFKYGDYISEEAQKEIYELLKVKFAKGEKDE